MLIWEPSTSANTVTIVTLPYKVGPSECFRLESGGKPADRPPACFQSQVALEWGLILGQGAHRAGAQTLANVNVSNKAGRPVACREPRALANSL